MPHRPPLVLRELDFHLPVEALRGSFVVGYDDGSVLVGTPTPSGVQVIGTGSQSIRTFPAHGSELGDVAIQARPGARAVSVHQLPPGRVFTGFDPRFPAAIVAIAMMALLVALLVGRGIGWAAGPIPMVMLLAALTVGPYLFLRRSWPAWAARNPHRYQTHQGSYGFHELLDDRPHRRAIERQVAHVKDEYGAMLSDVVVRIEQPALFDAAAPRTRAFTELLLRWDDVHETLDVGELATLGSQLAVAFAAAKEHAAAVGMDHLPESAREPAGRALKALRLARSTSTPAPERKEAIRQATRILDSLRLYYLPSVAETEALLGGRKPKALPGRWEPTP